MIYTLKEEIHVMILLIVFGIYISSYVEFIYLFLTQIKKKILRILLEIIGWITQIIITYLFVYKMADGYVPLYFILFIALGILLYFLFRFLYFKELNLFSKFLYKLLFFIISEIIMFIVPNYVKEIFKAYIKRKKDKKIKDLK